MTLKHSKKNVVINSILFVIFMSFALLQLNDPDPLIWFTIYFIIALVCLLVNFIHINQKIIIGYICILAIGALFHLGYLFDWLETNNKEEILGKMVYEKPYLEGSREFIGLVLGIFGLIFVIKNNQK